MTSSIRAVPITRRPDRQLVQLLALGTAQVLAWASSTYLPAILGTAIAAELQISRGTFFAAFSLSLVVMALVGPLVGRRIDRTGGRRVLLCSNLALASGLLMLAFASGIFSLYAAWCVIGLGMGLGLYDALFATLVQQYGKSAGRLIVGVTLIGGFASTVGWPLSSWMLEHWGWRWCCAAWALLQMCVALPLHYRYASNRRSGDAALTSTSTPTLACAVKLASPEATAQPQAPGRRDVAYLCLFSGATAFVTSAMAVHLPTLLSLNGATAAQALFAATLLGPAQVAARLAEYGLTQHAKIRPLTTARIATALHPAACLVLGGLGGLAAAPLAGIFFALLHGAGNGMISIARGVLPLALFGPVGYGALTGKLALFARTMQACALFAFVLILDGGGLKPALLLSGGLSLAAFFALCKLRVGVL
ncbi:MAG: MFS transporter [Glaciimonas sp.]|nr:MFS transporter [Glaciimonas sp.]